MTGVAKTLHAFWSQILPAYAVQAVPDDAQMPYITYNIQQSPFGQNGLHQARIWTHSTSLESVAGYAEQVHAAIPEGGKVLYLPDNTGALLLHRGVPFIQTFPDEMPDIHSVFINVTLRSYKL